MWKLFLPVTSDRQPADTLTCRAWLVPRSLFVYCNNSSTPQFASKPALSMHILHIHCMCHCVLIIISSHRTQPGQGQWEISALYEPVIVATSHWHFGRRYEPGYDGVLFYSKYLLAHNPRQPGSWPSIPVFMNHVSCSSTVVHLKFELSGR